jgi:hypothetical protein
VNLSHRSAILHLLGIDQRDTQVTHHTGNRQELRRSELLAAVEIGVSKYWEASFQHLFFQKDELPHRTRH